MRTTRQFDRAVLAEPYKSMEFFPMLQVLPESGWEELALLSPPPGSAGHETKRATVEKPTQPW